MRNSLILTATILLVFGGSFLVKGRLPERGMKAPPGSTSHRRIVSMAPSITETLFALELGDRVVGVTRYCQFPPEAQRLANVGGFHDPSFEALVALKPDVVVTLENEAFEAELKQLRVDSLVVAHKGIEEILDSFLVLGEALGATEKATQIVSDIESRLEDVEQKTAGRDAVSVMCSVYRQMEGGKLGGVAVAAGDAYFDQIITIAGGRNACRRGAVRYPIVSREGIMRMNPQVIIDLVPSLSETSRDRERILADWQEVADVEAVRSGRVYLLDDDYASLPGPRFILLIEKLARLLHPEADW
jgi:iron complex transport system substrate-binding protein